MSPLLRALSFSAAGICLGLGALTAAVTLGRTSTAPSTIEVHLPDAETPGPTDGQMKVYVTGAVRTPGVYAVHPGDRVADAVEAAGGPADDADMDSVNLARRLRDEDHVTVPRRGERAAASVSGAGAAVTDQRIDLNTATAATLETLPGVGPARAQRIAESRVKDGPFTATSDLVKRKLVPQSVFDGFKELVDVR